MKKLPSEFTASEVYRNYRKDLEADFRPLGVDVSMSRVKGILRSLKSKNMIGGRRNESDKWRYYVHPHLANLSYGEAARLASVRNRVI